MYTTTYRIVGAYELLLSPRGEAPTTVPIDRAALRDFVARTARELDLEPWAIHVADDTVRLVALAAHPRAVLDLSRWAPRLVARPLHHVDQFFATVAAVQALAAAESAQTA